MGQMQTDHQAELMQPFAVSGASENVSLLGQISRWCTLSQDHKRRKISDFST